jgi:hypothetical protein
MAVQQSRIIPEAIIRAAIPLPSDNFELAQNEGVNKDHARLVKRMRLWQEFLAAAYGVKLKIDYRLPLFVEPEKIFADDNIDTLKAKNTVNLPANIENDRNPEIFLAKYMTDILALRGSDIYSLDNADTKPQDLIEQNSGLTCAYQNIILHYEPEKSTFKVTGLRGDLTSQRAKDDDNYVSKVLFENIKAAYILAQSAKAAGWTSVNFGSTTDIAKRYALQIACEAVGIDCSSEKVDLKSLPQTFHGEKLENIIKDSLEGFLPSMYRQIWPDEAPSQNEIDIDDLDSIFAKENKTSAPQPAF